MAINKKLIHFKLKSTFLSELEAGNILDTSIVFIQDAKEIWTHNTFYPCPYTKEEIDLIILSKTMTKEQIESVLTGNITSHTHDQYLKSETDPTVPSWAKQSTKPTYTASEVGAAPTSHTHTKSQITDFPSTLPNPNSLTLKINSGSTEGTNLYTYNGSSGKSLDIKAGSNVTLTPGSGSLTISSTNTTYNVATSGSNGLMSSTDKAKLDRIESGAQVNDVVSVAGKTGAVTLTKSDVGLGNVTNESKVTMFTNAALTGTPTAPTAGSGTNTTQIATTAFVQSAINSKIAASDAMIYKGTIGSTGATITALPTTHSTGWTYKVITAGTYAGQKCEVGDMIIALVDRSGSGNSNSDWTVIQSNIDGAVTGPSSSVDSRVAVFSGSTGKVIKDSGFTISKSVPSDAKFTDTVYTHPTTSGNKHIPSGGSSGQILRWASDGTATWGNDNNTTYSQATSSALGLVKIGYAENGKNYPVELSNGQMYVNVPWTDTNTTYNVVGGNGSTGLIKNGSSVTNASGYTACPIVGGVPYYKDTNTTYNVATTSTNGLMSSSDKAKLDGIATNANNYVHPTTSGNKHIPAGGSSGQILRWASDGTATWGNDNNTTYSAFKGATSSAAGGSGLVPAPAQGDNSSKYLKADGTWATPPNTVYTHPTSPGNKHIPSGGSSGQILRWSADGTAVWGNDNNTTYSQANSTTLGLIKIGFPESGKNYPVELNSSGQAYVNVPWTDTNTTYGVATTSSNGLMSSSDKSRLDSYYNFYEGANTATSISKVPITKRLCVITLSSSGSFTLASTPPAGREIHMIVKNNNPHDITITIPNSSNYVNMNGDDLTIAGSSYADINVISDGTNMYIRFL